MGYQEVPEIVFEFPQMYMYKFNTYMPLCVWNDTLQFQPPLFLF